MKKTMKKRAGFTLVEVLMVIILTAILSGSTALLVGGGTDKARSAKTEADLVAIDSALILHAAETHNAGVPDMQALEKYMDRKIDGTRYELVHEPNGTLYARVRGAQNNVPDSTTGGSSTASSGLVASNPPTTEPVGTGNTNPEDDEAKKKLEEEKAAAEAAAKEAAEKAAAEAAEKEAAEKLKDKPKAPLLVSADMP